MLRAGRYLIPVACIAVASCSGGGRSPAAASSSSPTVATASDTRPYSGIGSGETVHFTGTEPFWGGEVSGGALNYTTPENQAGALVAVDRFAGRNGISFSGDLDDKPFMLAVTPGKCSDGMSDRTYPFVVTLQVKGQQRKGCAWTDKQPFTGSRQP